MRPDGVMSHELVGDLLREFGVEAATHVNFCQLIMLALVVRAELCTLAFKVGTFGVCLGVH
jgi:hypothetical protein